MNTNDGCELCRCQAVQTEAVNHARELMEDPVILGAVSDFFKVMSDGTRMRIMAALDSGEMCVCHLSELLDMTKSAISHQLKVLKDASLVKSRREGKNVFYSLKDEHVRAILETGIEHIKERD